MKKYFRHILSFFMVFLMLFSTVGFNIISTFCAGCEEEHIKVTIVNEIEPSCPCCEIHEPFACCSADNEEHNEHRPLSSKLVKLFFDSPEAKSKGYSFNMPVNTFLVNCIVLLNLPEVFFFFIDQIFSNLPLESGRKLLSLHCILRN